MKTRLAGPDDLDAVMALYDSTIDAMAGTPFDACWRRDFHPTRASVRAFMDGHGLIIGIEDSKIVAVACLDHDLGYDLEEVYGPIPWQVEASCDRVSVIHLLAVDPRLERRGLGRLMLDACVAHARSQGALVCRLDVITTNLPAVALYEHYGFKTLATGTRDLSDEFARIPFAVMELVL